MNELTKPVVTFYRKEKKEQKPTANAITNLASSFKHYPKAKGNSKIYPKTYKNLQYEAERAGIPVARVPAGMVELGRACGVRAGVVSVNDKGFAQALQKEMEHTDRMKEDAAI